MTAAPSEPAELYGAFDQAVESVRQSPSSGSVLSGNRLCVAMATFDDFDGAWFTIQSLRLHHPGVADRVSLLLLDNNPGGVTSRALRAMVDQIPNCRYLPFEGYRGTSVRHLLFAETDADIVCCVDSHVLLSPGSLEAVLDYFDDENNKFDLLHGVLLGATSTPAATHMEPIWSQMFFGRWGLNGLAAAKGEPFEVEMHGLGVFACMRESWPGLNFRFRGFGGEEGYLHEKVRRRGGRNVCHPRLGWLHRFERNGGTPYPNELSDRIRNFRIGWRELGWDEKVIEEHFRSAITDGHQREATFALVERQLASPRLRLEALLVLASTDQEYDSTTTSLQGIDIGWLAERVPIPQSPTDERTTSARRAAIELAGRRGYNHALVLDPGATLNEATMVELEAALNMIDSGQHSVVVLSQARGAGVHLVHSRAYEVWPSEVGNEGSGAVARVAVDVPNLEPAWQRHVRRAVVAVLLPRDHLPFIRDWSKHHRDQGWEVCLLDNTGSVGSVRHTSAHRRDLLARRQRPSHHSYTQAMDDGEVTRALRALVDDLGVMVQAWQPKAEDGEVVHGQAEAYARFIEANRAFVDWAAFIDADEYLCAGSSRDWDDLLDRSEAQGCPRILLDAVRYERRWSEQGLPRSVPTLQATSIQHGGSKNLVKLRDVTRADVHWAWEFGENDLYANPDRLAFGFRHYRDGGKVDDLRLSRRKLSTWIDESVAVQPKTSSQDHVITREQRRNDEMAVTTEGWRPRWREGLETAEVADGMVVYGSELDDVSHLNSTAAAIFLLCDGKGSRRDIERSFAEVFALTEPAIEDVDRCLEQLYAQGLLH